MNERQAFLNAIQAAAWDDAMPRLIYADWLNDQGEDDESERQRQFVDSEKWLRKFAEHEELNRYDEIGWKIARLGKLTYEDSPYERLLYLLKASSKLEEGERGFLPFDIPDNIDFSDELWKHFEIVTGWKSKRINRYSRALFRCAC